MPAGINADVHLGSVSQDALNPRELGLLDLEQVYGRSPNLGSVVAELRSFTEGGAAGVLTGSVLVPANALILDIKVWATVLFLAGTSATMKVGDAADDDGWYTGIDMKATDLVVGEQLRFGNSGGKVGAYLVEATGELETAWSASDRIIKGIITTVGTTSTAGRAFMMVIYVLPTIVAASYVAT